MVAGFAETAERKEFLVAGVDLNHRPLGYEYNLKRNFNELAGVVACSKERKIEGWSVEEFLFWVGFGLKSGDRMSSSAAASSGIEPRAELDSFLLMRSMSTRRP